MRIIITLITFFDKSSILTLTCCNSVTIEVKLFFTLLNDNKYYPEKSKQSDYITLLSVDDIDGNVLFYFSCLTNNFINHNSFLYTFST